MRIRVKICGITRVQDALDTVAAGVDAIGLVFYDKSPRFVSIAAAAEISNRIPAFVSRVALFKDADEATVRAVLDQVEIDLLQFHGSEAVSFCERFSRPYIKALGIKGSEHDTDYLLDSAARYASAKAVLLDGHAPGEAGGSGQAFDWQAIHRMIPMMAKPVILAGGLQVANISQAVETVQPYAVDVSSGVESAPGKKDKAKITAFMQQVQSMTA